MAEIFIYDDITIIPQSDTSVFIENELTVSIRPEVPKFIYNEMDVIASHTKQQSIFSNAQIVSNQKNILSNTVIKVIEKITNIFSNTKIIKQSSSNILSDTQIVTSNNQKSIFSNTKIKGEDIKKNILSDTKIVNFYEQNITSYTAIANQEQENILSDALITNIDGIDFYTKVMLHMNGDEGSTNFIDECGNIVTSLGATITQIAPKFPTGCGKFDAGDNDALLIPTSSNLQFGTEDFTIEFWYKTTGGGIEIGTVLNNGNASNINRFNIYSKSGPHVDVDIGGIGVLNLVWNINLDGNWHHFEFCRHDATFYLYNDGILSDSQVKTVGFSMPNGYDWIAGKNLWDDGGAPYDGYLDELKVSKGICRHLGPFIPEAKPYSLYTTYIQKDITSNAKIVNQYIQDILSDTKIKVLYNQKNLTSDTKIKNTIIKSILSNANIVGIVNIKRVTNFVTKLLVNKVVQTVFNTIVNRTLSHFLTNLTTQYTTSISRVTDLRTKLVSNYDTIEPKTLNNIIVKKDGSELLDIDYSTLKIQFNLNRTPSNASFILARHHDDLDHTLVGIDSTITTKNKIQIYDGTILLFTGYITQIQANSTNDTVGILAEDARYKINETSYKIGGVPAELSWGGKYDATIDQLTEISTGGALEDILEQILALNYISGYEDIDLSYIPEYTSMICDCGTLIDTLLANSANINWYIDEYEFLRFQKVSLGSVKSLPLSSINAHRHIYDVILNDININKASNNYYSSLNIIHGQQYTRYWLQSARHPDMSLLPKDYVKDLSWFGFQRWNSGINNYVGINLSSISGYVNASGFWIDGYFIYQWLAEDVFKNIPSTIIGFGNPEKDLYLTNYGKKITNVYWEEKEIDSSGKMGLYQTTEESYDYLSYALDLAYFELSQNNKLTSDANITLLLDAYEYYGITLKDLINLSNTLSTGCYINNNGFPLNIQNITVDCATRIVTLSLTNYGKTFYAKSANIMGNYQKATSFKIKDLVVQTIVSGGYGG